jgi:hypothetical protein
MIDLARANALKSGLMNIEYHLATIDKLPLADATVDCVISNCVINLAPDKPAVCREIARILKPGGRLAISDIALKRELPAEIGDDLMAHVGCIAGAILIEDYRRTLIDAGFAHVEIIDSGKDLNAYAKVENQVACCSPPSASAGMALSVAECCAAGDSPLDSSSASFHARLADLLRRYDVNDYAASVRVFAIKPGYGKSDPVVAQPPLLAPRRDQGGLLSVRAVARVGVDRQVLLDHHQGRQQLADLVGQLGVAGGVLLDAGPLPGPEPGQERLGDGVEGVGIGVRLAHDLASEIAPGRAARISFNPPRAR